MSQTFGGVCLIKLVMEITSARINMFLQHYNMPTTMAVALTVTLELTQLQAGFG